MAAMLDNAIKARPTAWHASAVQHAAPVAVAFVKTTTAKLTTTA